MLKDLGHKQQEATKLLCDNGSTIALSKNAVFHKRNKHIDTRYHYIKELINAGEIIMEKCRTTKQFIDILTKPLGTRLFEQQRDNLGIGIKEVENLLRLRGNVENSNLNRWVGAMHQQGGGCVSKKWGPRMNQCQNLEPKQLTSSPRCSGPLQA